jgi:hypothetical protein
MKRVIVLIAYAMSVTSAFGAAAVNQIDLTLVKGFNGTKNVNCKASNNMSGSVATTWAANSAHTQGDKQFWTSSAFGGIASKTVVPGTTNASIAPTTVPNTPTDSTVDSAYTTM